MVSSGNQSLDIALNGGFFIGTLVLLYEDNSSQYFGHLLKTYLAEGVVREQMNMVVDPEPIRSKQWWVNFLPQVNLVKQK